MQFCVTGWYTLQKWKKSFHSMTLPAILPKDTSQCLGKLLSVSTGLLLVFARFLHASLGSKLASFGTEHLIAALSYITYTRTHRGGKDQCTHRCCDCQSTQSSSRSSGWVCTRQYGVSTPVWGSEGDNSISWPFHRLCHLKMLLSSQLSIQTHTHTHTHTDTLCLLGGPAH